MKLNSLWRKSVSAGLLLCAWILGSAPFLLAQQPDAPVLTLDAAIDYAKQHSPLLAATQQSVLSKQAAIAAASAEWLPRVDVGAALRGSNQPTESALGFPLTPLADIGNQPFRNGHLTGLATVTQSIYTGGRLVRLRVSLRLSATWLRQTCSTWKATCSMRSQSPMRS